MQMSLSSHNAARDLRKALDSYGRPILWKSLWQMVNTFIPLGVCWYLAYRSLEISYLLTLALGVLCAGFIIRITIFQHDCGHHAFFRSRRANEWLGHLCSVFNLTPFVFWLRQHAYHHTKINNLDRGARDIFAECLTVEEYRRLKSRDRLIFRITRNPLIFFPIIAPLTILVGTRFPVMVKKSWKKGYGGIYLTNVLILLSYGSLGWVVGFRDLALVHIPIIVVASAIGLWLDFLGHKFPDASWVHDKGWTFPAIALNGCGYFRLPEVLHWFSGNIGIHHVHHLNPRIPNYLLQKCHDETPALHVAKSFTLWEGIKAAWLVLWDEDRGRLIQFSDMPAEAPS